MRPSVGLRSGLLACLVSFDLTDVSHLTATKLLRQLIPIRLELLAERC
jgi:hypothetical protein